VISALSSLSLLMNDTLCQSWLLHIYFHCFRPLLDSAVWLLIFYLLHYSSFLDLDLPLVSVD